MKETLIQAIRSALNEIDISYQSFAVEHPADMTHGDYSTNVALVVGKQSGTNPREMAEKIKVALEKNLPAEIDRIEIAGPGFINFICKPEFFAEQLAKIISEKENFGRAQTLKGKTIIMDYTDPNPFKQFHIGHLMSNAIGESIARLLEWNGAKVIRTTYGGDVGLHVAKALYGMQIQKEAFPHDGDALADKTKYLGETYAYGSNQYEENPEAKAKIDELNIFIYKYMQGDKNALDEDLQVFYTKGKKWSIEHFEEIYKKLGTHFDHYIFESEIFQKGQATVRQQLAKGIFEESEGAIIFRGENFGLHTRVFVSSKGAPTYEAKEIGLAFKKEEIATEAKTTTDTSIVITANEQTDYFKVVYKALEQFASVIASKTQHIEHGMMRFAEGKMSSRKGNIITGESLILEIEELVREKMAERDLPNESKEEIATDVAVAAIKYSILKQSPGRNIIFDREKALSFEGDSGPYLQYTAVRANAVLEKAKVMGLILESSSAQTSAVELPAGRQISTLEKHLYQFPEVIERANAEKAPQYLITYLTELASAFNSFYGNEQIVVENDSATAYKLALTEATKIVLQNGLNILSIRTPEKM